MINISKKANIEFFEFIFGATKFFEEFLISSNNF